MLRAIGQAPLLRPALRLAASTRRCTQSVNPPLFCFAPTSRTRTSPAYALRLFSLCLALSAFTSRSRVRRARTFQLRRVRLQAVREGGELRRLRTPAHPRSAGSDRRSPSTGATRRAGASRRPTRFSCRCARGSRLH